MFPNFLLCNLNLGSKKTVKILTETQNPRIFKAHHVSELQTYRMVAQGKYEERE